MHKNIQNIKQIIPPPFLLLGVGGLVLVSIFAFFYNCYLSFDKNYFIQSL